MRCHSCSWGLDVASCLVEGEGLWGVVLVGLRVAQYHLFASIRLHLLHGKVAREIVGSKPLRSFFRFQQFFADYLRPLSSTLAGIVQRLLHTRDLFERQPAEISHFGYDILQQVPKPIKTKINLKYVERKPYSPLSLPLSFSACAKVVANRGCADCMRRSFQHFRQQARRSKSGWGEKNFDGLYVTAISSSCEKDIKLLGNDGVARGYLADLEWRTIST
jgi:hypothetical protein